MKAFISRYLFHDQSIDQLITSVVPEVFTGHLFESEDVLVKHLIEPRFRKDQLTILNPSSERVCKVSVFNCKRPEIARHHKVDDRKYVIEQVICFYWEP